MTDRLVINTSPLIAFAKMDAMDVVAKLPFELLCPKQVEDEIMAGAAQGHTVVFPS